MALQSVGGVPLVYIPQHVAGTPVIVSLSNTLIDATNEALICIGQIFTSDGSSHTIDTTGSSAIGWLNGTVSASWNAGTTVKVGLAAPDTSTGGPARAAAAANVITFDVSKTYTGAGSFTSSTWNSSVPDAGTKTIANGDLVAFAVQMTNQGGTDSLNATTMAISPLSSPGNMPIVTSYTGGSYAAVAAVPNAIITFSDGAFGYFFGGCVASAVTDQQFNSGSSPNEYGNYFQLPFPAKIYGAAVCSGANTASADFDVILYSDPLGTPASAKSYSVDATIQQSVGSNRLNVFMFSSPYTTTANQPLVLAVKPTTANNARLTYKTYNAAADANSDPLGTNCYAVNRSSGAFAAQNSSKDRFSISLVVGAFDDAVSTGGFPVTEGPFA